MDTPYYFDPLMFYAPPCSISILSVGGSDSHLGPMTMDAGEGAIMPSATIAATLLLVATTEKKTKSRKLRFHLMEAPQQWAALSASLKVNVPRLNRNNHPKIRRSVFCRQNDKATPSTLMPFLSMSSSRTTKKESVKN